MITTDTINNLQDRLPTNQILLNHFQQEDVPFDNLSMPRLGSQISEQRGNLCSSSSLLLLLLVIAQTRLPTQGPILTPSLEELEFHGRI